MTRLKSNPSEIDIYASAWKALADEVQAYTRADIEVDGWLSALSFQALHFPDKPLREVESVLRRISRMENKKVRIKEGGSTRRVNFYRPLT